MISIRLMSFKQSKSRCNYDSGKFKEDFCESFCRGILYKTM